MNLWLPPAVSAELVEERRAHHAELLGSLDLATRLGYWNGQLKRIDPYLELVKAREDTKLPGLRPGYYHLMRVVPGAPPWVEPIEGPNGEFREPDSSIFDRLRRTDIFNARAQRDRKKKEREIRKAREREQEREREARVAELRDRMRAAWDTSVSLTRTQRPWTQTAKARRG